MMRGNTKERSAKIQQVAEEMFKRHGSIEMTIEELLPLAQQLSAALDCHIKTAKRHMYRALLQARRSA